LALAEKEKPAPVAVAAIQLSSLEKPKFSAGPRYNPVLFLEKFESYYAQVREYHPDKLDEVITCPLRDAEDFVLAHRHILTDFSSFKKEFLRFFWSKAKRKQLRKELLAEQYDPTPGTSMVQFFTRQYACWYKTKRYGRLVGYGSKKLTIEPTTRNQMKMAITAEQLKLIPKPAGPRRRGRNQPKHGTGMKVIS
jgi:hypothetical protein